MTQLLAGWFNKRLLSPSRGAFFGKPMLRYARRASGWSANEVETSGYCANRFEIESSSKKKKFLSIVGLASVDVKLDSVELVNDSKVLSSSLHLIGASPAAQLPLSPAPRQRPALSASGLEGEIDLCSICERSTVDWIIAQRIHARQKAAANSEFCARSRKRNYRASLELISPTLINHQKKHNK